MVKRRRAEKRRVTLRAMLAFAAAERECAVPVPGLGARGGNVGSEVEVGVSEGGLVGERFVGVEVFGVDGKFEVGEDGTDVGGGASVGVLVGPGSCVLLDVKVESSPSPVSSPTSAHMFLIASSASFLSAFLHLLATHGATAT